MAPNIFDSSRDAEELGIDDEDDDAWAADDKVVLVWLLGIRFVGELSKDDVLFLSIKRLC